MISNEWNSYVIIESGKRIGDVYFKPGFAIELRYELGKRNKIGCFTKLSVAPLRLILKTQ